MPLSRPLLALLSATPLLACGYGHHDSSPDGHYYPAGSPASSAACGNIEEAIIDADQLLDVEPGIGAGTFIEYDSDGTYHVTTSCDAKDGSDCYWDILVTPLDDAPVLSLAPVALESDDSLALGAGNQVRLVAYTGQDFDGFTLQTEPGAAVEVDALLDGACGHRYLFWVGDGALRSGAPSNPIDLVPSAE